MVSHTQQLQQQINTSIRCQDARFLNLQRGFGHWLSKGSVQIRNCSVYLGISGVETQKRVTTKWNECNVYTWPTCSCL